MEVSWILKLTIAADGSLDGPKAKPDARTVAEGEVVLVGHLLALLVYAHWSGGNAAVSMRRVARMGDYGIDSPKKTHEEK